MAAAGVSVVVVMEGAVPLAALNDPSMGPALRRVMADGAGVPPSAAIITTCGGEVVGAGEPANVLTVGAARRLGQQQRAQQQQAHQQRAQQQSPPLSSPPPPPPPPASLFQGVWGALEFIAHGRPRLLTTGGLAALCTPGGGGSGGATGPYATTPIVLALDLTSLPLANRSSAAIFALLTSLGGLPANPAAIGPFNTAWETCSSEFGVPGAGHGTSAVGLANVTWVPVNSNGESAVSSSGGLTTPAVIAVSVVVPLIAIIWASLCFLSLRRSHTVTSKHLSSKAPVVTFSSAEHPPAGAGAGDLVVH